MQITAETCVEAPPSVPRGPPAPRRSRTPRSTCLVASRRLSGLAPSFLLKPLYAPRLRTRHDAYELSILALLDCLLSLDPRASTLPSVREPHPSTGIRRDVSRLV